MSTLHRTLPRLTGSFTNAVYAIPAFQPGAFQFGAFQMGQPGYLNAHLPRLAGAFASVGGGPEVRHRGGGSAWWLPPLPKQGPRWWKPPPVEPIAGKFAAHLPMIAGRFDDDLIGDELDAILAAVVTSIAS